MGIDAALFSDNEEMYYYDREYNLWPFFYDNFLSELYKECKKLRSDGLSKKELVCYLQALILNLRAASRKNLVHNRKDCISVIEGVLKWVDSLPDTCRIISRNDYSDWDEYYKLGKKYKRKGV